MRFSIDSILVVWVSNEFTFLSRKIHLWASLERSARRHLAMPLKESESHCFCEPFLSGEGDRLVSFLDRPNPARVRGVARGARLSKESLWLEPWRCSLISESGIRARNARAGSHQSMRVDRIVLWTWQQDYSSLGRSGIGKRDYRMPSWAKGKRPIRTFGSSFLRHGQFAQMAISQVYLHSIVCGQHALVVGWDSSIAALAATQSLLTRVRFHPTGLPNFLLFRLPRRGDETISKGTLSFGRIALSEPFGSFVKENFRIPSQEKP